MKTREKSGYGFAFALVTLLFFLWGFLTAMNDILIPFLKKAFDLTHTQAMLVQFAFFMAYFIGSVVYFAISVSTGDPIRRIGYKNGILAGLGLAALGAALFYPAAEFVSFGFFLLALFILGLGFTLLQISANPYVAELGPESSASARLNLSQGFNSLGTTVAPLAGSVLIYSMITQAGGGNDPCPEQIAAPDAVRVPYLLFAAFIVVIALAFAFIRLPELRTEEEKVLSGAGALKFRNLRWGILAIFFYVGAEVSIGSNLISFFGQKDIAGLDDCLGSLYVAMYWGGLMTGRFMGAISMQEMQGDAGTVRAKKAGLMLLSGAFTLSLIILGAWYKLGDAFELTALWPYGLMTLVGMLGFLLAGNQPQRILSLFALAAVGLLLLTTGMSGQAAFWAVIAIGLCNSIMWSNIFTLAIDGLGAYKSQGSSLLVMAIIGGALFPLLQGLVADMANVQISFLVPVAAYLYIAWYGFSGYKSSTEA